jgi:hypothetical protein
MEKTTNTVSNAKTPFKVIYRVILTGLHPPVHSQDGQAVGRCGLSVQPVGGGDESSRTVNAEVVPTATLNQVEHFIVRVASSAGRYMNIDNRRSCKTARMPICTCCVTFLPREKYRLPNVNVHLFDYFFP